MQISPGGVENLTLIGQFALEKSLKSINYIVPQNTIIYTSSYRYEHTSLGSQTNFEIHFKVSQK